MAYTCPTCGRQYDPALFQFGVAVRCDCGTVMSGTHEERYAPEGPMALGAAGPTGAGAAEERLQHAADRIAYLIMSTDYPRVDIDIERRNLQRLCRELCPEKPDLYERVYESRFRRLWEQFRR